MSTIRIDKSQLPSGQFSITFEVPNYGVYRSARRRYPQQERAPYSVEELMLAMSMVEVNDQKLQSQPRDMVDRLEPFPIKDRQFLTIALTEMFFLSSEQAKAAKELADYLSKKYESTYKIPKGKLPTHTLSIDFNTPSTGVQFQADKKYKGMAEMGCSLEEFLLAYCISAVNGADIEKPKDIISVLDEWTIADVQFAATVFINMFTIGDGDMDEAKKLAGDLKAQLTSNTKDSTKATTGQ